jgi:hypothetical protein
MSTLFSSHLEKADPEKLKSVSNDLVRIVLENADKEKNVLAWKIGKRLREAQNAGDLLGNMGLVWQYIQLSIESDAHKLFSISDLGVFLGIYDTFSDSLDDLKKISFGAVRIIVKRLAGDKVRAKEFLQECIQHQYSEKKIKIILEW